MSPRKLLGRRVRLVPLRFTSMAALANALGFAVLRMDGAPIHSGYMGPGPSRRYVSTDLRLPAGTRRLRMAGAIVAMLSGAAPLPARLSVTWPRRMVRAERILMRAVVHPSAEGPAPEQPAWVREVEAKIAAMPSRFDRR